MHHNTNRTVHLVDPMVSTSTRTRKRSRLEVVSPVCVLYTSSYCYSYELLLVYLFVVRLPRVHGYHPRDRYVGKREAYRILLFSTYKQMLSSEYKAAQLLSLNPC